MTHTFEGLEIQGELNQLLEGLYDPDETPAEDRAAEELKAGPGQREA